MNYTELKRKALESFFERANPMQKQAIFKINGAVLIIAGAGSGKTTVLVNRIANMLRFGNAYHDTEERALSPEQQRFLEEFPSLEKTPENAQRLADIIAVNPVKPWNILAITFTNKAAGELRERLCQMLGEDAQKINAATFHSACVRILRREIEHLGFKSGFAIYDDDDSKRVIKEVMKRYNIDEKIIAVKVIKNRISHLKDKMISPADYALDAAESGEEFGKELSQVYSDYQQMLMEANAVDFDDIIFLTVKLFEEYPDVLEHYRNLYKYIMVDEYQDTNFAQYRLISLLAGDQDRANLGVVGDDDQSIYKFRGATVENILNFEKQYKNATVIRLEQNYRSTENILNAANAIISNNTQRKKKKLWSDFGEGEKVQINLYQGEQAEANGIVSIINEGVKNGGKYSDYAILYRNNALSRSYETALGRSGIPYRVLGGLRFYDRKEIRDIMAYLSLLNNPYDIVRFRRVINEPKRGIGDTTIDEVVRISTETGLSPIEVCASAIEFAELKKKANALKAAANLFEELDEIADNARLDELIDAVVEKSGYLQMLKTQGDEGANRLENINELKSNALENPDATLPDFLEQTALVSDTDNYDANADCVSLMTMHSAKGLEFPVVFMVAAEDNIFPSAGCRYDLTEMEEERRLAYVAVTRAKKRLIITHSKYRMLYGKTSSNPLSQFVREIPEELVEKHGEFQRSAERPPRPERRSFLKEETSKYRAHVVQSAVNEVMAQTAEELKVGDRVKHGVFGEGTLTAIMVTGNDAIITVNFDTRGEKKLMRNTARLTKL